MVTETLPLAEITREAIRVLCKEIGVVNTVSEIKKGGNGIMVFPFPRADLYENNI